METTESQERTYIVISDNVPHESGTGSHLIALPVTAKSPKGAAAKAMGLAQFLGATSLDVFTAAQAVTFNLNRVETVELRRG